MDYQINYSGTQQARTYNHRTRHDFEWDGPGGNGLNVKYDASNPNTPKYSFLSAADAAAAATPANYELTKFSTSDGLTQGHDFGGAANGQMRIGGTDSSTALQFGVKLRDEGKSFENRSASFTPNTAFTMNNAVAAFDGSELLQRPRAGVRARAGAGQRRRQPVGKREHRRVH